MKYKTIKRELIPIYDNAKSFYNKAFINVKYDSKSYIDISYELISYNTKICIIKDNKIIFYKKNINSKLKDNQKVYSYTTLRHIKEFIKKFSYILELNYKDIINKENITKNDIVKLINAECQKV